MSSYDVVVIGAGISGLSVGFELAEDRSVLVLDMEKVVGFHSSGRSVATFIESNGTQPIRALSTGSRDAFENPADMFEAALLSPLGMLRVAAHGDADLVRDLHATVSPLSPQCRLVSGEEAEAINPALMPGYTELAMVEPSAAEIDVDAMMQGYSRGLRRRGGELRTSSRLVDARRKDGRWHLTDATGVEVTASVVVNAAGAWADEVAGTCGARSVGMMSLRRTAFMVGAPQGLSPTGLPLTGDIRRTFYFLPHAGMFLCSPCDATPHPPADVKPDELEIARSLDTLNEATQLKARSIRSPWAGLRNFVPDDLPVVGFDDDVEGFFWYAAQGGYGIQIAPALSRTAAALVRGGQVPPELQASGLSAADIAVGRASLAGVSG